MKRTVFLILLAIVTLSPAALCAQDSQPSLYNGWGFGFQMGAGGIMPTGSLADDLKACAIFNVGLTGTYNRARLKADLAYGQPSFKNENPYAVYDEQGRYLQRNGTANTTLLAGAVQLGYTVWHQGRFSVTPNAGVSFGRLSWDMNDIKWEKDDEGEERPTIDNVTGVHENNVGWIASVDFEFRLHGKITDSPFGDGQSHYSSLLRVSPFVTHASYGNFSPSVKGTCLGITVTYAGLMHLINR